jgi:hypothetical protein
MQYRDWGVDDFVVRYLTDYSAMEHEANEFMWQVLKAASRASETDGRR